MFLGSAYHAQIVANCENYVSDNIHRFRVTSVDSNKKVKVTKSTGMEHQSFHKDEVGTI